jgi:hypothetical protein
MGRGRSCKLVCTLIGNTHTELSIHICLRTANHGPNENIMSARGSCRYANIDHHRLCQICSFFFLFVLSISNMSRSGALFSPLKAFLGSSWSPDVRWRSTLQTRRIILRFINVTFHSWLKPGVLHRASIVK